MDIEHKVDVKQALRVFDKVTKNGEKREDGWHYRGLTCSTDFDGYTVYISNGKTLLTVFFHNKFTVDYANPVELEELVDLLAKVDRADD
ncbi:hypothetical protein Maes01_02641 [Microbulbifer aestuariivivens]|uniref:DUF3081 domain-containing protein n=1 Tax=Microbulbifer aestuariivivens TaxID=1908308 RepID=A0ABP9WS84_9GAMM